MTTRELTVDLEAVTPLFLGGADPDTPEARAASFRGALRFWWRALAAEPDLTKLREREAKIFGDTTRASAVRLDVETIGQVPIQRWRDISQVPDKGRYSEAQIGLNYLGFALARGQRGCMPAGTRLRLHLRLRRDADDGVLREASAALWLLVNLGGLGTRARRGFGSVVVTSTSHIDGLPPWRVSRPVSSDLARHLESGLAQLRTVLPRASTMAPGTQDDYPVLTNDFAKVVVLNAVWPTWQEALGELGFHMARFRTQLYPTMNDLAPTDSSARTPERAAFGLPIQYFRRSTNERDDLVPAGPDAPSRRASPLLLKVSPMDTSTTRAAVILTLLLGRESTFLPGGMRSKRLTFERRVTLNPLLNFLISLSTRSPSAADKETFRRISGAFQVVVP